MTQNTVPMVSPPGSTPQGSLWHQLVERLEVLTRPHASIIDATERRRSRAIGFLALGLVASVILIIGLLAASRPEILDDSDTILYYGLALVLLIAFSLNQRGHARTAGLLIVIPSATVTTFAPFLPDSSPWVMAVSLVPILVAGIVLSPRVAIIVTLFSLITQFSMIFIVLREGSNKFQQGSYIDMLMVLIPIAVCIITFMFQIQGIENIRNQVLVNANEKLKESESILELRVKQRTSELEIAKHEAEEARELAEQADKVKSQFLASMSHELRTPLNSIINFTQFVAEGDLGDINDDQNETLNRVISSGRHLLNLINDVLDMSKIEAGSLKLFVQDDIDLKTILQQVVDTGGSLIKDKPVTIQAEIAPNLPTIRADRQRVLQIMLNIMSNACKFTEQGTIKLKGTANQYEVILSVQDSGPGIALEDQPNVFEAFKQTEHGLRQGGGTGLGMPISRSLVDAHGGRLWLESEIGKGATFFVALPIKSENLTPIMPNTAATQTKVSV